MRYRDRGEERNRCNAKEQVLSNAERVQDFLGDLPYKEFRILILSKANKVLKKVRISEGGVSGTVVDPKKIYKIALDHHSSSLILGHNHPSGNTQPSETNHKITKKIKDCGILLDIAILDHIIVGNEQYYSYVMRLYCKINARATGAFFT